MAACGRAADDARAGLSLRLERVRRPSRSGVRVEAFADLHRVHDRGGNVCGFVRGGGETAGSLRSLLGGNYRRRDGEPGLFPLRLHHELALPILLLRRAGRNRQRVWLCDGCAGDGEVVPGQAGPCHRAGAGGIWRRLGGLWPHRRLGIVPSLRLADHLHDPGRHFLRDDHAGVGFAEKSHGERSCGIGSEDSRCDETASEGKQTT